MEVKYCACGCGKKLSADRYTFKQGCHQKGERNNQWKGGRLPKRGYYYIHNPAHPNSTKQGYIAEHRFVMEQTIGRFLLPNEIVHHINGDKKDNRPDNLKLMKHGQHTTIESTKYSRAELLAQLKEKYKLSGKVPKTTDFANFGSFYRLFGSWNNALRIAGFPLNRRENGVANKLNCSTQGCNNKYFSSGFCSKCYEKKRWLKRKLLITSSSSF